MSLTMAETRVFVTQKSFAPAFFGKKAAKNSRTAVRFGSVFVSGAEQLPDNLQEQLRGGVSHILVPGDDIGPNGVVAGNADQHIDVRVGFARFQQLKI